MREFQLTTDYIELIKLLKLLGIAETGGHAKTMVEAGEVFVNNRQEYRKRAKLRHGDIITIHGEIIQIRNATL